MKKTILVISAALMAVSAVAQNKQWTLRECIDYAIEHNIAIRQTELSVESAELDLNTSRNSRLPSLSAGVGQNFSFGRMASEIDNSYINTQASNTSFSASANMPLFQGFRINNQIKADKFDLQAAAQGLETAKQSLELNVAGYYLDVLLQKEILAVNRDQIALIGSQVENTAIMVEEGKVAPSQLYDIKAQLAEAQVAEVDAANNLALSLLNLSQALNLEDQSGFDIAGAGTSDFEPAALRSPDAIYEVAEGIKPQVREAELRLESSRQQVKIAGAARLPSLSLGASFGDGYYHMFGQDGPQQSFVDQIRNKHSEGVGLNLSIPIFNRFQTRNSIRAAKLGVLNSSLELEGVRQTLYKEIRQAWQGAVSAQARYEATTRALEASEEAFRAMELRYNNQKATAYEYSEAGTRLISSRSEQARAKYDHLFATRILDFYLGQGIDI